MANILLGEAISRGAEHQVYRDRKDNEALYKLPGWWSRWQSMSPDLAERDLGILDAYGIPYPATEVVARDEDENGPVPHLIDHLDGRRTTSHYVLRQRFIPEARPVRLDDLQTDSAILTQVADIVMRMEEIYRELDLGVDLLGGEALKDLAKVPLPVRLHPAIHNLLIDTHDRVQLCDTRFYDFNFGFNPALAPILRQVQRYQFEILGRLLADEASPEVYQRNGDENPLWLQGFGWASYRMARWRLAAGKENV